MYNIVAIIGKSGAGKDYLLRALLEDHLKSRYHKIISNTTRPPREGEKDGENYHFLSYDEFSEKLESGQMLEATIFREWMYGTSYDNLDENKINVGVFNPAGLEALLDIEDVNVMCIYVKCEDKTRLIRQLSRESNPDVKEILRRYQTDEEDFSRLPNITYYTLYNEENTFLDLAIINLNKYIFEWGKNNNANG